MLDPDACNWSSLEVASYVRDQLHNDIAWIPHVGEFDAQRLAGQLLDDDVNGFALLDDINKRTLKEDYGIKSAGVRSAISRAIERLRKRSIIFASPQDGPQPTDVCGSRPQDALRGTTPSLQEPVPPSYEFPSQLQEPESRLTTSLPASALVGTNARSKEYITEDSHGRKRRKLAQLVTIGPGKYGPAQDSAVISDFGSHLPDKAINVDELIYDTTHMGAEIKIADPQYDSTCDTDFYFVADGKISEGHRWTVNRRIQHVLRGSKIRNIAFHGRPAVAVEYTREAQLPAGVPLSTTVYQEQAGGKVTAVRTNAALLRFQQQESIDISDFRGLEHEHLLHGPHIDDDIVAEDDQSFTSSLMREIEQDKKEAAEEAERNKKVTKERAREIVSEEIQAITMAWKLQKELNHEKKHAWKVWKETREKRTIRERLVNEAEGVITDLQERLAKYVFELVIGEWNNELELKKECNILEVTVQDIAEKNWRLDVLQRREEPENPTRARRRDNRRRTTQSFRSSGVEDFVLKDEEEQDVIASIENDDLNLIYRDHRADQGRQSPLADGNRLSVAADFDADLDADIDSVPSPASEPPQINIETLEDERMENSDRSTQRSPPDDDFGESSEHFVNARETLGSSDAESADELPSPSKFTKQLLATHSASKQPTTETIILSSDPPSPNVQLTTPAPPPKKALSPRSLDRQRKILDNPQDATIAEIQAWDWSVLESEDNEDELNNAVLAKLIHELDSGARKAILKYLHGTNISTCISDVQTACDMLPKEPITFLGKSREISRAINYASRLFICWHNARRRYWSDPAEECAKRMVRPPTWEDAYMRRWYNVFKQCLQKAEMSPITIEDSDDDAVPSLLTPNRKRKRHVKTDKTAQSLRQRALDRAAFFQQGSDAGQLSQMISAGSNTDDEVAIYAPEGSDTSKHVYLNKRLAKRLKPHQVEGIRFMWREITVPDDEDGQGCLLAHTMGLGKTAQTIGLLVTIAETISSPERLELIPESFRKRRTMILCPPALITNWRQELQQWDHKHMLGNVYSVDSVNNNKFSRLNELRMWSKGGGVLLVGYTMFARLVSGVGATEGGKAKKEKLLSTEESEEIVKILLNQPTLVVADEAHMLKNDKSKVASAAVQIRTHRRIGLTGSPMSNNTQEIYALISWVAPKYLGTAQEFRAHYAEPIEQGTYLESTAYEKRKSMVKLAALNRIIGPKLNRADITVLKGSIKQKVEFVLTVPLTEIQITAYERFVTNILSGTATGKEGRAVTQAKLFGWLAVLTLLCNHPWMFMRKLREKHQLKHKQKSSQLSTAAMASEGISEPSSRGQSPTERLAEQNADEAAPGDEHVSALEIHEAMVENICRGLSENWDAEGVSHKVHLVEKIIRLSVVAGDKVLLFSHSIPSLDFLELLLQKNKWKFARIDGSCKQQDRTMTLENMKQGNYDVLLISTRAGGLGLNIQTANRVIIFDFGFNPTWEEQAIGRAYRLGQQKPVYVYRFVAGGTFESMLYNKAIFKTSLASRVVDKKNPERNANRKPAEWLYPPTPVEQEDIMTEHGKDVLVLDKILAEHAAQNDSFIRAIKTMETLQRDANDEPLTEEEQKQVEAEIQSSLAIMGKTAPPPLPPPPPPSSLAPSLGGMHGVTPEQGGGAFATVPPPATAGAAGPSRSGRYNAYTGHTRVFSSSAKN